MTTVLKNDAVAILRRAFLSLVKTVKNKIDMGKLDDSSGNKHIAAPMANTVSQIGKFLNFIWEDRGGTNTALEFESDNQGFYWICFIYCMQVSFSTFCKLI